MTKTIYMFSFFPKLLLEVDNKYEQMNIQIQRDLIVKDWISKEKIPPFPMKFRDWTAVRKKFENFTLEWDDAGFLFTENSPYGRCQFVYNGEWKKFDNKEQAMSSFYNKESKNICFHTVKIL